MGTPCDHRAVARQPRCARLQAGDFTLKATKRRQNQAEPLICLKAGRQRLFPSGGAPASPTGPPGPPGTQHCDRHVTRSVHAAERTSPRMAAEPLGVPNVHVLSLKIVTRPVPSSLSFFHRGPECSRSGLTWDSTALTEDGAWARASLRGDSFSAVLSNTGDRTQERAEPAPPQQQPFRNKSPKLF